MAAIYTAADLRVVEPVVMRGIEIARELGDAETRAALLSLLGNALTGAARQRFAEGLRLAEEGVAVAEEAGLSVPLVARGVSWINFIDGRFEAAERATERAMEASVRAGHREKLSDLYFAGLFMHNHLLFHRGPLDQALGAMEETYRLAVKAGNRTVQAGTTALIAWMHFEREQYAEANELAGRFLELAQPLGNVGGTRTAAAILVLARAALGEPPPTTAGELLEMEGLNPSDLAIKSHLVSEALIAIGDLRRAADLADLAYRHAGGRLRELWATLALGEVKSLLGPTARKEAEEWIRRAGGLATEIGSRWGIAATSLAAARASLERGDHRAGEAHGNRALNVAREIGFVRLARRAERILDELRDGAPGGLRAASSAD